MKILHVTPAYYPATYWGGPIFSVYALNNALAKLPGVALKVLTTDAAGPRPMDRQDPIVLDSLNLNHDVIMARRVAGASVSLGMLRRLPGLVRWADVVHLTGAYSFPTIPTLLLCRFYGKPLVWSPRGAIQDAHEWQGSRRRNLKRWWERLCNILIRRSRVIAHTTSEREQSATQARLPSTTARIVPNGVDVPHVPDGREWLPEGRLRLMYLGRLSPKKGIENLLEAIGLLRNPAITLVIYGAGDAAYTAQLKSLSASLGLSDGAVTFAGHVDGAAKEAAFHGADVCIVPSYSENFCMVVAEALAHGVPVIASRGTPWAEVEKYRCGLWVNNSPADLAQAVRRIGDMELPEMGMRGWGWMKAEFDWRTIAPAMVNLYREIL
jgi:glycosyltransferase involved in cell wall biosynthesis